MLAGITVSLVARGTWGINSLDCALRTEPLPASVTFAALDDGISNSVLGRADLFALGLKMNEVCSLPVIRGLEFRSGQLPLNVNRVGRWDEMEDEVLGAVVDDNQAADSVFVASWSSEHTIRFDLTGAR